MKPYRCFINTYIKKLEFSDCFLILKVKHSCIIQHRFAEIVVLYFIQSTKIQDKFLNWSTVKIYVLINIVFENRIITWLCCLRQSTRGCLYTKWQLILIDLRHMDPIVDVLSLEDCLYFLDSTNLEPFRSISPYNLPKME